MATKTIVGLVILSVFALLMVISLFKKHDTFFNIREITRRQLLLFRNCRYQYFTFYGLPLLLSVGLALLYEADSAFYTEISVVIGILLSMLFAILSILTGYDFSNVKNTKQKEKVQKVVAETINAIVFDSVLCIFMMIYGLVIIVISGVDYSWLSIDLTIIKMVVSGVAYYLFAVILLTLLLIVKHMSKIIEFKNASNDSDK